jgi:hypothetical protein
VLCGVEQERMEESLLPFCLRDTTHDWRRLQLVNRSMCSVYRQLLEKEMERVLVSVQSEVDQKRALHAQATRARVA